MAVKSDTKATGQKRVRKKGTVSTNSHRFETFNEKISKIKINPIRRGVQRLTREEDLGLNGSHFESGLLYWKELNLSQNFASFVQDVAPLCDSLPQLLHHQERILSTLLQYVGLQDALSLQPLLSLLSDLAHDLGATFEPYFLTALSALISIAAQHQDVEVVEWAFSCIAWLFKFLAKLLVPDIWPTYQLLAPLLGKGTKKEHVARFAAEALSFLVRKAALLYTKERSPLDKLIAKVYQDVRDHASADKGNALYQFGVLTFFSEAMKGVNAKFHSCAPNLLRALIHGVTGAPDLDLLLGLVTGVIHHAEAATFGPILGEILTYVGSIIDTGAMKSQQVLLASHLLFRVTAVRKGSRGSDWKPIVTYVWKLQRVSDEANAATRHAETVAIVKATASTYAAAPVGALTERLQVTMEDMIEQSGFQAFLSFCALLAELNRDRFDSMVAPYFYKSLCSHWHTQEQQLLVVVPSIMTTQSSLGPKTCPVPVQEWILATFNGAITLSEKIARQNAYLDLLRAFPMDQQRGPKLFSLLRTRVNRLLGAHETDENYDEADLRLYLGAGFQKLLTDSANSSKLSTTYQLCSAFPQFLSWTLFLRNLLDLIDLKPDPIDALQAEPVFDSLIRNLGSSDRELRKLSLKLLRKMHSHGTDSFSDLLSAAISIEDLPLDFNSARQGSMLIRRLSGLLEGIPGDPRARKAIAHFCFGLLTLKFSPWWSEAVALLKTICEIQDGESVVGDLVFAWLEMRSTCSGPERDDGTSQEAYPRITQFQSLDVINMESMLRQKLRELEHADKTLKVRFEEQHSSKRSKWDNFRSQALLVLKGLPSLAEKKSRRLVPHLLHWANHDACVKTTTFDGLDQPGDALERIDSLSTDPWSRVDRIAMLELFGAFQNPGVLYKSSEVFAALLDCLARPDAELQRAAFNAIMTWKSDAIAHSRQNILNLIDEARFRDELATLLSADGDESVLRSEHFDGVLPVVLRVLYGKAITRSKASDGSTRRKAIFNAIFRLPDQYVGEFLEVALRPLRSIDYHDASNWDNIDFDMRPRSMLGLVNLLKDLASSMGERVAFLGRKIFGAALFCLIRATEALESAQAKGDAGPQEPTLKDIRQIGIQCISLSFEHFLLDDLSPFLGSLYKKIIEPRNEKLPVENAHSVSGMLKLFAVWASKHETVTLLAGRDVPLMAYILPILTVPSAKEVVQLHVLEEILKPIVLFAEDSGAATVTSLVLRPYMTSILKETAALISKNPSPLVLTSTLELVASLAELANAPSHGQELLKISASLLGQPRQRVSLGSKGNLLVVVKRALTLSNLKSDDELLWQIHRSTSAHFSYFLDRSNRLQLCDVMTAMSSIAGGLEQTAEFCDDLNSFSTEVLDEPDFGRRIQAFNSLAEAAEKLSYEAWRPLLHNCLFYLKDEDISLRTSASFALHKFIDAKSPYEQTDSNCQPNQEQLLAILLDQLRLRASDSSDVLRNEVLLLMAHLVKLNPSWTEISDMHPLLMNGDEEASIFNNIMHIQRHRRLRALRRLAAEAQNHRLVSKNITKFWIPLLEPFVLDKVEGSAEHNLAFESTVTIAALATGMQWPQLRSMMKRYSGYIRTKRGSEKQVLKVLAALIDTLSGEAPWSSDTLKTEAPTKSNGDAQLSTLGSSLPERNKFGAEVEGTLLPPLKACLHEKDESTVVLRAPVAFSIVKLLKTLSAEKFEALLPPVLTDLCHILRSRAQESRDLTRVTLAEISRLIGAERFGFLLKELRGSLRHGYQRHVLSYTVHSILVATAQQWSSGDLDHCLPELVAVIMDDIFGSVGQEKDAEEYVSKMKEVKSSKSFDSMELVAKTASINKISHLVRPLQALLEDSMDAKMARKIDEILRRMGVGLLQNPSIDNRATLVFCYEVIMYTRNSEENGTNFRGNDHASKTLLLQATGMKRGFASFNRSAYGYKLARFALDLLRMVLARHEQLRTPSNLSGFLPIIGDLLLNAQEEVRIATLRLLTEVLKTPFTNIQESAEVYAIEAVKIIRDAVSTNAEIAQAAIKLVTTVLRERHDVTMRETDLAYLIKRVKSDLEEPDRQGVTFNFLKAVLQRKIVITEVYEIMDAVAGIMITSQAEHTRNTARSLYFQFLMNYPQAKVRFSKQLAFLVKNLEYKHVEGRQSVLEAVYLLLGKVGEDPAQDMIGTFFLPLVLVMANDESPKCRKMAGSLLRPMFERSDEERAHHLLKVLDGWVQDDNQQLNQMALRVYAILLEAESRKIQQRIPLLLAQISTTIQAANYGETTDNWEAVYYALTLAARIGEREQDALFDPSQSELWASVQDCLRYRHAWVKLAASQLIAQVVADATRNVTEIREIGSSPRRSCRLLMSSLDLLDVAKLSLRALQVAGVGEELATQLVRNVVFVSRFCEQQPMRDDSEGDEDHSEDEHKLEADVDGTHGSRGKRQRPTLLLHVVRKVSFILRREPLNSRAPSLVPNTAALQLLAALCSHLPASSLASHLTDIIVPLHHLTDPTVTAPFSLDEDFKQGRAALTTTAQEILALLQTKVGTEPYVRALAHVREEIRARREGRRVKRRIEVVAEPERVRAEKRRKEERQKERRKEKVSEFRARRRGQR